jgi:hypothetical protein
MAIPEDIQDYVEKQINLMISQTEAYLPLWAVDHVLCFANLMEDIIDF